MSSMERDAGVEPAYILICNQTPYRLGYPLMVGEEGFEPINLWILSPNALPLAYSPTNEKPSLVGEGD